MAARSCVVCGYGSYSTGPAGMAATAAATAAAAQVAIASAVGIAARAGSGVPQILPCQSCPSEGYTTLMTAATSPGACV
jgi:hypothetical protein